MVTQNDSAEKRVYPVNPLRRTFVCILCLPFIPGGIALVIFGKPEDRFGMVILASVLIAFALCFYWLLTRMRLEVSPSGVKLRFIGYTLETPWSNIQRLRMDRGQEAFITEAPMECGGARQMAVNGGGSVYDPTARKLVIEQRYLPIEAFSWHLRHGLGEDVRRFAPQLQAALDAGAPAPVVEKRKVNWVALTLFIAFILGALILLIVAPKAFNNIYAIIWAIIAPLTAVQFAWISTKAFRRKSWITGILMLLLAIIMALASLAVIGSLLPDQKNNPAPANSSSTPAATPAHSH